MGRWKTKKKAIKKSKKKEENNNKSGKNYKFENKLKILFESIFFGMPLTKLQLMEIIGIFIKGALVILIVAGILLCTVNIAVFPVISLIYFIWPGYWVLPAGRKEVSLAGRTSGLASQEGEIGLTRETDRWSYLRDGPTTDAPRF